MRTVRSRSASGDRDGCASADMVKAPLRRCKHSTLEDLGSHITGFRYYVAMKAKRFWSAGQAPLSGAGVANRAPAIAGPNQNENRGQHRKAEARLPSFIVLVLSRAQVSHEGVVSHNSDG